MALETNSEAYLPVVLSLIKLHMRSFWHTLKGGKNGLDLWDFEEDLELGESALSILCTGTSSHRPVERKAIHELEGGQGQDAGQEKSNVEERLYGEENGEDDGPWYMGKAKDEYKRRRQDSVPPREDEDPVEVSLNTQPQLLAYQN